MSRNDFQDRLSRISSSQPERRKARLLPSFWSRISYPLTFLGAFALGYATVAFARWMRAGMGSAPAADDASMAIEAGMGIAVGFVIRQLFSIRDPAYVPANALGSVFAIVSLHNFAWWFPQTIAAITDPGFAEAIRAASEPNSLIFRGIIFK